MGFVRRYAGGQWLASTAPDHGNGNPLSAPLTFTLVGMLTEATFCDPSDTCSMRELSGTAILKTSCLEYRQLYKGSGQLYTNLYYVEDTVTDSYRVGQALLEGGHPILSFGSLQRVRHPLDASEDRD